MESIVVFYGVINMVLYAYLFCCCLVIDLFLWGFCGGRVVVFCWEGGGGGLYFLF